MSPQSHQANKSSPSQPHQAKYKCKATLIYYLLAIILLVDCCLLPSPVSAGDKGRDIIIYNGKVILKGGKKKGNIIISNGGGHEHGGGGGQGNYKYKKKYMNYGGFW